MLGLTMGCARCHDHKYDPVSQEDYYRFYAFFNAIEEPGLYSQTPDPTRAHEPFIVVEPPELAAQRAAVQARVAGLRAAVRRALSPGPLDSAAIAGPEPTDFAPPWASQQLSAWLAPPLAWLADWQDARREQMRLEAIVPRTMVMKELPEPRPTFVLTRGQYDHPDKNRPVTRGVPGFLGGRLPDGQANRLDLARWLTSADNPLAARVEVNRLWETLLGTGLVRTSEDFGLQGEWPSHPELLDWLAVEFRERGWDVRHIIRLVVTSATYRQDSRVREELATIDPDNRLLGFYPRRRLEAEFVRDQALYVAGLLDETTGGRSVKPYQPDGLWSEVAMIQSNTRAYVRGELEDLWRRSLYTYWKRACPPPSLMTFDAPTRESCTIRRTRTNTPLQALVLWNDEQYVEAARGLALRTLEEAGDDPARIDRLMRRCTGRPPEDPERAAMSRALADFRASFAARPQEAAALLNVGARGVPPGTHAPEAAAWTMLASAALNLSETIVQH
jgi:hypothetical protein